MDIRKHAPVQDARNQNSAGLLAVKHNMLSTFYSAKAATNVIATPAPSRIVGKHPETFLEAVEIAHGPILAPSSQTISTNAEQASFGTLAETEEGHGSARRCRKVELFANTCKHITLGDTTGITLVDGGAQGGKFRLVLPLFALQGPQGRAHHFTGILVKPALHFFQNKAIKFIGKIDVAGWRVSRMTTRTGTKKIRRTVRLFGRFIAFSERSRRSPTGDRGDVLTTIVPRLQGVNGTAPSSVKSHPALAVVTLDERGKSLR